MLTRANPEARITGKIVYVSMTVAVLIIATICTVKAVGWVNTTFPGFLINERLVVSMLGLSWTGTSVGLTFADKIVEVNGESVSSVDAFARAVKANRVGESVTYTINRKGETLHLWVPAMRFTWFDLVTSFGITLAGAILYMLMGVVVYIMKPDTKASWAFLMACFFLSLYTITIFDIAATHYGFIRIYLLAAAFFPAAFVHLSLFFPEPWKVVEKYPYLTIAPYLISFVLVIPLEALYPKPGFYIVWQLVTFYMAISAVVIVGSVINAYFRPERIITRQRAKVVLLGSSLAFPVPAFAFAAQSMLGASGGLNIPTNLLTFPLMVFPASIAFAIIKHNLFDVDIYIKRTVGYVIITAILTMTYIALHTATTAFVGPSFGSKGEVTHALLFALLVVFFFNPLNHWIQEAVDKLFFRKQYDFKATVTSISNFLTSLNDLDEIIKHVIRNVRKELFLDSAGVILMDHHKKDCQALFLADGAKKGTEQKQSLVVKYNDPLLQVLAEERRVLTQYDIEEDPKYASVRESCSRRFLDMGASLALPLFHGKDFTGMFTLGHKKSGHFYTREDIDLLKTVSAMTSTAIQEAREKGQRDILMQLFSKHVSSEVAETIWQQRDHFLDGGRPRSQMLMATVLFTDLAGFSSVSEKTDPQALMTWLNSYLDVAAKMIIDHHGVIDDYFGDGMKANFGVPVPRTSDAEIRQDATNAVNCALDMERQITRLNAAMQEEGKPPLKVRVGIYTGPVVAGSLGSSSRLKYTTVGDAVNIASRLESFDKDLILPHLASSPCRILIGESTLNYLDSQYKAQPVGELSLKGKDDKITAYCVLGRD